MKVSVILGNMAHYDQGLSKAVKIVRDTLTELGVDIADINLGFSHLPFYDGIKAQVSDEIISQIRESEGIMLACTAQLFAPTAIMQTFLEYLELDEYSDTLREKQCYLLTLSQNGGERSVLEYLSRVVQHLGGYDTARIGLQEIHIRGLESDAALREIIEKETEDYYRALRQNRKYVIPRDYAGRQNLASITAADVVLRQPEKLKKEKAKVPVSEISKRLNLDAFTEQQEKDIAELTRLFTDKFEGQYDDEPPRAYQPAVRPRPVTPRVKTVKQITQSLPHYFQPQLSNGLTAVIQLNITGAETFDGYLSIVNTECEYADGITPAPDITITADSNVWQDVLKNKYTAQKAFMIGGLKVRGNFVLLTKFDALFKLSEG